MIFNEDRGIVRVILILALTCIVVATRMAIALTGGLWADEAFVLLVAKSSSFGSMTEFLHFHESHPPLFYIAIRLMTQTAGAGETAVRTIFSIF